MKILFLRALVLLVMALSFLWFTVSIINVNGIFDVFDFLLVFTCSIIFTVSIWCVMESLK